MAIAKPTVAGRIDPNALNQKVTGYQTPKGQQSPYSPAPAKAAPPPESGPTNFWGRIAQVGVGKVNLLNAYKTTVEHKPAINSNNSIIKNGAKKVAIGVDNAAKKTAQNIQQKGVIRGTVDSAEKPLGATARFLGSGTAKLVNQGYQEGKQVVDTVKMQAAAHSNNPVAFKNAQQQSQKDYQGFKKSGGLFNVGTATNEQESKKGDLKTGIKKIGGATLESASELVPMAEWGKAAKVYKIGEGVVDASESAAKAITKNVVLGILSGAAGNAGAQLLQNGKVGWKDVARGAGAGAVLSAGSDLATRGIGILHTIFKEGPTAALDKLHAKPTGKATGAIDDVLDKDQLDKASAAARTGVPVKDESAGAEKVGVKTPTRPGIKEVSQTDKVQVKTPTKMTPEDYAKKFNDLSKSYDKAYKDLESKTPAEQKVLGKVIDNSHIKQLEKLNDDYKNGVVSETPSKVTKISSETSKAGKTISGKPTSGVNIPDSVSNPAQKLISNKIAPATKAAETSPTPRTTPTVEGSKVSGSALRSEQKAVQANLTKEFEGKATYDTHSYKTNSESAVKLVHDDPKKAMDIAMGRTPGENTVHEVAVRSAIENKAIQERDVETLRQLSQSSQHTATSEAGQRLGAESYTNQNSPVKLMKEVSDTKAAAVEKKLGKPVTQAIKEDVKAAKAQIKAPSKDQWKVFVESLKC